MRAEPFRRICNAPNQQNKYSQQRDVGIAVGHRLPAYGNNTYHRNQHPQKPKPAHGQVRLLSSPQDEQRDHAEQQRGKHHLPEFDRVQRIENGQL